jgi:cytochrome bd-type quinol oxidase subunit 2
MGTGVLTPHDSHVRGGARPFVRHYAEMVAAMYVGMLGLGAVFAVILVAAGTTAADARYDLPVLFAVVMCFNMSVSMAAWMRHRGHAWDRVAEMVGAMVVPAVIAIGLFLAGVIEAGPVCPIECMASLATMLAVMLIRFEEYSN